MIRSATCFKCSLSILAILACISPAYSQPVDAQGVQNAINRAVKFLFDGQLEDGGWPEFEKGQYPDGVSSLTTLALLNSGVSPEQPGLAKALRYLGGRELHKTYTISLQTMALCAANPNKYAGIIRRNADWLASSQMPNGGWGYGQDRGGGGDPSNSQFALLALHEAQRAGVQLSEGNSWKIVFGKAKQYWETAQNRDGSFAYRSNEPGSGSMTSAGIASLAIVGSQLGSQESSVGASIQCCGATQDGQDRIENALNWLGRNFRVNGNPGSQNSYHLYYIYGLERVGRLTGRRYLGDHDWYREGAEHLILLQEPIQGKISPPGIYQGNEYSETAFALLFLAKGKRQTVVSRLQFNGAPNDWNHHKNAIQYLTAHTEQAWKRDLSWQNVDINKSTVADLLETPVLYISSANAPAFTRAQKELLKEYVEQGGFIFAEGCNGDGCNGQAFEDYFRKLVVELFDQPLEKLSPDHPIWFAESRVVPEDLPKGAWLYGVQTCCRLGVVYAPFSLGCRWELNTPYGIKPDYDLAIQKQLDTATKIGINVLAYATGKDLKEKLDTVTILEEVKNSAPTDRGVFFLPILRHNAGFDDAPRAISNLVQWLDKSNPFQISDEKRIINIATEELKHYPVVFLHGRGKFQLSEVQRDALRDYLDNGGFIFADAICADEQFTENFRREMQLVVGQPLTNLEASHAMFTSDYYGFDIGKVTVIDPDLSGDNVISAQRKIAPRLEVAKVDNRIAVVFSPLDLSCALESRHSMQCRGYVRDDAARIGINVLLFALQQD